MSRWMLTRALPVIAALAAGVSSAGAQGVPVPGQAGWTSWMNITQTDCVGRARAAITGQGLDVRWVDSWYVHGYGGGRFISITCVADDGSTSLVNPRAGRQLVQVLVVVQSGSGDTGNLRDALRNAMLGRAASGGATATVAASWATSATSYRGKNGVRVTYACPPGGTANAVWGTDIYTDDSSVCTAAVHMGLITFASGGTVSFQVAPGQSSYVGSARNGITTTRYGSWTGSFVFVR